MTTDAETLENAVLSALKMEEGAKSHRMQGMQLQKLEKARKHLLP